MKDKTAKLNRVAYTLECCRKMEKSTLEDEQRWNEQGLKDAAFTAHMVANAYAFIASLLENDLKDEEE